jgi:hypothetical protein
MPGVKTRSHCWSRKQSASATRCIGDIFLSSATAIEAAKIICAERSIQQKKRLTDKKSAAKAYFVKKTEARGALDEEIESKSAPGQAADHT